MVPSEGRCVTGTCERTIMRKDDWVEDVPKQGKMVAAKDSKLKQWWEDRWLPQFLLRNWMSWVTPEDFWPDRGDLACVVGSTLSQSQTTSCHRWGQGWANPDGKGLPCLFLEAEALFVSVGNEETLPGAATACCREGAWPCIAPW